MSCSKPQQPAGLNGVIDQAVPVYAGARVISIGSAMSGPPQGPPDSIVSSVILAVSAKPAQIESFYRGYAPNAAWVNLGSEKRASFVPKGFMPGESIEVVLPALNQNEPGEYRYELIQTRAITHVVPGSSKPAKKGG